MVLKHSLQSVTLLAIIVLAGQARTASADTWQLEQDQNWKSVQTDKYLLVMVRTENLVSTGQTMALYQEWSKLRKEFPEIPEQDLDTFIEAELLFCDGKFTKAARNYNKFLDKNYHESELYDAALYRQFCIAEAFLAGRKTTVLGIFKIKGYAKGASIMESIDNRAGDRPIGRQALVAIAESYEKREKFNEAYFTWWNIYNEAGIRKQTHKQALLGMARCKHKAYKGPKYYASCLDSAKSYYEDFIRWYKEDAKKLGIDEILKQIEEQRAYKQFSVGQYYEKTGNRLAANLYYQMVIRNWPESESAELTKEALTKNLSSD